MNRSHSNRTKAGCSTVKWKQGLETLFLSLSFLERRVMREMLQRPETQTHWSKLSVYHMFTKKNQWKITAVECKTTFCLNGPLYCTGCVLFFLLHFLLQSITYFSFSLSRLRNAEKTTNNRITTTKKSHAHKKKNIQQT